ncbi:MAG: hypothetical protein HY296_04390 [Thaumarchaeota archaeon]|nr:hypothetical protein [Nitrososphaerota archaeon]
MRAGCQSQEWSALMVHSVCTGELIPRQDGKVYCDICGRLVPESEILIVDNSPSPFSG